MSHEKFKSCIDACNQCASECEHCATSCLHEKDNQNLAICVELDRFCADMCKTAAAFLARCDEHTHSFAVKFCGLCAEICDACAAECEKHSDLEHCKTCAEACHKCAVECQNINKEQQPGRNAA